MAFWRCTLLAVATCVQPNHTSNLVRCMSIQTQYYLLMCSKSFIYCRAKFFSRRYVHRLHTLCHARHKHTFIHKKEKKSLFLFLLTLTPLHILHTTDSNENFVIKTLSEARMCTFSKHVCMHLCYIIIRFCSHCSINREKGDREWWWRQLCSM